MNTFSWVSTPVFMVMISPSVCRYVIPNPFDIEKQGIVQIEEPVSVAQVLELFLPDRELQLAGHVTDIVNARS